MKKILYTIVILFVLFIPSNLNAAKSKTINICNSKSPAGIMYTYIDMKQHVEKYVTNPFKIDIYNFVTEDGKTAYCIHGGKRGPGAGDCRSFQLITDFVSDGCDSGKNYYECGLLRIISYSMENGYGYVETATALRLWTAAKSGEPGAGVAVNSEVGQRIIIKNKVYTNTAKLINKGYDIRNPEKLEYVLYQPTGNELEKAFELYNVAETAKIYTASFKVVEKDYQFDKNKRVTVDITTTLKDVKNIKEIKPLKNAKLINMSCSGKVCSVVLEATVDLKTNNSVKIPLEITYNDPDDIMSIVKEYKTNNDDYQTFLVIEEGGELKKQVTVTVTYGECDSSVICCPKDSYPTNKNCKCDDTTISYDIPKNCSSGKTTGSIEDPKLCAITTKESSRYKLEDITYDGKKLCSVYCREKYEFKFMPGIEAIAGRTYKYDVKGWQLTTSDKYLTAVKATRECTSTNINYKTWKADYNKINSEILEAWNNWKEWEARANNETPNSESKTCPKCSGGCCGGRDAVKNALGEIITPAVPCTQETDAPGDTDSWTWYKWNNARYSVTLPNGNTQTKDASGQSGSSGISCSCSTCPASSSARGDAGTSASVEASKAEAKYKGLLTRRTAMINAVENCSYQLSSGVINKIRGYEYKSNIDFEYEDKYGEGTSKITEFDADRIKRDSAMSFCNGSNDDGVECQVEKLCPECNTEISSTITEGLSREELIKWECSGSGTSAKCTNNKYLAPKSKAAYVSVISEEATYQKNKFYTQLGTGVISLSPGKNYIELEDNSGQTNYLFPLELNKQDGNYETVLKYEKINEDFRNQLNLTKIENIEYKCLIKVKNEMPLCEGSCFESGDSAKPSLGFIFRPIDMGDIFPNKNRLKGINWATPKALSIMNVIQERDQDFWLGTKPRYTVTLLPENIRKIKKYNDTRNAQGGYQDYSIECQTDPSKADFGYCGSTFLKDILKNEYANKFDRIPFDSNLKDPINNYYWKRAK